MLLVGNGSLKEKVRKQVEELKLDDSVIFLGVRKDIPQLLMAMDIFVFPSLYEGMPNTVIEAQATGLKCIISDTITREADITGLVSYTSLNNGRNGKVRFLIIVSMKEKIHQINSKKKDMI